MRLCGKLCFRGACRKGSYRIGAIVITCIDATATQPAPATMRTTIQDTEINSQYHSSLPRSPEYLVHYSVRPCKISHHVSSHSAFQAILQQCHDKSSTGLSAKTQAPSDSKLHTMFAPSFNTNIAFNSSRKVNFPSSCLRRRNFILVCTI